MSTTVRYGYNSNRAGQNLVVWCGKARAALIGNIQKPAGPICKAWEAEWEAYFAAITVVRKMDDRELRAALKAAGLTV